MSSKATDPYNGTLSCGCIRGHYLCNDAVRLWEDYNQAYRDSGNGEKTLKALELYNNHFEKTTC